jgi:DNA repair protein RecN (Recombination protein N)
LLTKLSIQNYALIEDISIDFSEGLTTITGETGAGKSILLGGLGLILGNRAESNTLMNPEKKCIIEGEFNISNYPLQDFFHKNDIDYEINSIIRRELLPSGKSRAFINDTPVRLDVLNKLQNKLIDIHSQHQTLKLNDTHFQFQLIDALANTNEELAEFGSKRKNYYKLQNEFDILKQQISQEKEQHDYHLHLYNELETANFGIGEQEVIEQKVERLSNIELIQQNLGESYAVLSDEEKGLMSQFYILKTNFEKIKTFANEYNALYKRLESVFIELSDIENELANETEKISLNPRELENLNNRLQSLYDLLHKHQVATIDELKEIQSELALKINNVTNAGTILANKENNLKILKKQLFNLATNISKKRRSVIPKLKKKLENILHNLGMPEAQFQIEIERTDEFFQNGIDELQIRFSANKGNRLGSIKQVASGGELSRIMLAFKSILALHTKLPTIIFDEIDSGVSGEIAIKMAEIMKQMSGDMQVISITHLPQIAAKGNQQMKVYKNTDNLQTHTDIKLLNSEERIIEIAEMLGGKNISETAKKHAQELLQLKN